MFISMEINHLGRIKRELERVGRGRSVESVSVYLKTGNLPMEGFVEDIQKNEVSW